MSERLDRIEAILEDVARKQAENAEKIRQNAEETDVLLGAIAITDRKVQDLLAESADAKQRFEVLRSEAQNDREETRRLWNDAVAQMERDRTEARAQAEANREETRRLWNDAVAQMERDRVEARAQAEASRAEARAQADADRAENARRFDAMQETIQRLLVAVVDLGRDNSRLRDRVDRLEAG